MRFSHIPEHVRQAVDALLEACNGQHRSADQAAALFQLYATLDVALLNAERRARGLPDHPTPPDIRPPGADAHALRDKRRAPYGTPRTGHRRP